MASSNLPDRKSPSLILVNPTEEEKQTVFKSNGAEWRGALSFDAYLRREACLSNQALTRDGGITYWIMVDGTANENAHEPSSSNRLSLASCETYRKKALVWRNGKVEETIAHGIGSVFCAPKLRGHGYAARMMQELGKVLRTWQTENGKECLFSVLFSDIGKQFYSAHGWEAFHSAHISVPAQLPVNASIGSLPAAQPLYENDLEDLCKIDEVLLRKGLDARSAKSNTAAALIPDIECIRWHHAREEFVGKELHGKSPQVKGAIVGIEEGRRIWCYWTRVWYNENPKDSKGNTLHILRLVIEGEDQSSWEGSGTNRVNGESSSGHQHDAAIAALMSVAQQQAQEWHLEEVEIWNPTSATISAAQMLDPNATVVNRDQESIASLRWFPSHEGPVAESIDWIGNEKYGWC